MHTPATAGEMNLSSADDDLDLNVFDPYTQAALLRGVIKSQTTIYLLQAVSRSINFWAEAYLSMALQRYLAKAVVGKHNFACRLRSLSNYHYLSKEQNLVGAAYICTEDRFPSSRIQQMISNIRFKYQCDSKIDMNELCQTDYGDNILISHIATVEDLKKCIHEMLPRVLLHRPIKLIVIDSITAVFRGEYTPSEVPRRSRDLRDIAVFLHKLSVEHGLWIICVNQVTSSISDIGGNKLVPSLGLAWANLVTTRLMMSKTHSSRYIEVMFSPHTAPTTIPFRVTEQGIV
ncbi:DNA repair protein XRCC3 isoform X2 [Acyrthosiphon pisum]|uniref:RecA family profile 1 domain-containing protein n=1 Tax=Acyrthosiphon pisum TaxID=7029 RepID=A0A8R2NQD7_ACYPI|nr:DNA repair protein XRCC3 isoform X2 [Acyrthosiphon pisum]